MNNAEMYYSAIGTKVHMVATLDEFTMEDQIRIFGDLGRKLGIFNRLSDNALQAIDAATEACLRQRGAKEKS